MSGPPVPHNIPQDLLQIFGRQELLRGVNFEIIDPPEVGRHLVEVFSVTITLNLDPGRPAQLSGAINFIYRGVPHSIYRRNINFPESIVTNHQITLTGPIPTINPAHQAIGINDTLAIDVDLRDAGGPRGELVISRQLVNAATLLGGGGGAVGTVGYNQYREDTFFGQHGNAKMGWVAMTEAVEAVLEFTLIDVININYVANVYGSITCQNSAYPHPIQLFRTHPLAPIPVNSGDPIPLLRAVVALPFRATLLIMTDLWDRKMLVQDRQIMIGNNEFQAQVGGGDIRGNLRSSIQEIQGVHSRLQIKVTWR